MGSDKDWTKKDSSLVSEGEGRYAPVPGEPFRWLEDPKWSQNTKSFRELFPNGVPMRDEDLTPEQKAFLDAKRPMASLSPHSLSPQQIEFRARVQASLASRGRFPFGERTAGSFFDGLPVYRFTMSPDDGTAEDLAIMLRDGYNDIGRGEEEVDGQRYVWVDYQMDDEVAQGWYAAYPNVGMRRISQSTAKTAMPNPVDLGVKVGDIFVASWGWEQTNIDFYEVVRLTGASVVVRPISKHVAESVNWGVDKVMPNPGEYTGGEMTRRIQDWSDRPTFKATEVSNAYLWDGKPETQTSYA